MPPWTGRGGGGIAKPPRDERIDHECQRCNGDHRYHGEMERAVEKVACLMVKHRVSAPPPVDDKGTIAGLISKGDVICGERDGEKIRRRSWRLRLFWANATQMSPSTIEPYGLRQDDRQTTD